MKERESMTEAKLAKLKLDLSVQGALRGCVTTNLAGLYATEEDRKVSISAFFFTEATELDREYIEDAAGYVIGDYSWDHTLDVQYKLVSEITTETVNWLFLREEAAQYTGGPVEELLLDRHQTECSSDSASREAHVGTEANVKWPTPELSVSVQRGLLGQTTNNLAGLFANEDAGEILITACFFSAPTEADERHIEEITGKVSAFFAGGCKVSSKHELISEVERSSVYWLYLRAEVYNDAGSLPNNPGKK